MVNIIQIVPRMSPEMDGVGDYAVQLANQLKKDFDIQTHFITSQLNSKATSIDLFPIAQLSTHSVDSFIEAFPPNIDKVILHYSESYNLKNGAAFWLLKALNILKEKHSFKLLVMFHEFPRFYWRSKRFYHFFPQNFVAWRIAKISDFIFTSHSISQVTLSEKLNRPVSKLSVFSNIPEPDNILALEKRDRRLIIFGTSGRKWKLYTKAPQMIVNICNLLEIKEIYDIGPSANLEFSRLKSLHGISVVQKGELLASEINSLLSNSIAGIAYSDNNDQLAKSGVFASYCSHGMLPIITSEKSSLVDRLDVNKTFLYAGISRQDFSMTSLQSIADQAYSWYQNHNLQKTAKQFAITLFDHLS